MEAMSLHTLDDYMAAMRETFSPERATGRSAVLQYEFTGRVTGVCHAAIGDGVLTVAAGPHPTPSVVVRCDFDLWLAILAYKEDGLLLYEESRYAADGDLELLIDSNAWFVR
jgi:hypothetical protein